MGKRPALGAPSSAAAAGGAPSRAAAAGGALEVVLFLLGKRPFVVASEEVRGFRHSPRVRHAHDSARERAPLHVVSLSSVLGLGRDTSVDRRVLEVAHWGRPLGLEVTAIGGVRLLRERDLQPLPPLVARNAASRALLGLVWLEGAWAVALDLPVLLVERGIEVPDDA